MNKLATAVTPEFSRLIEEIPHIGFKNHASHIVRLAELNSADVKKSIKHVSPLKGKKKESCVIISAGPSVRRQNSIERILKSGYQGTIISADGAYIACLKAGLIPDFVITLDPHTTRVVRWFGDPNFEENSAHDDYFKRQDLDTDFRENSIRHNEENIRLVNEKGHLSKALVSITSPRNVVARLREAQLDMYWWNPLVDDPDAHGSLTRRFFEINKLPCMNTGGTVGTAAWVFAATRLNIPHIGVVGMDYGYYHDTPLNQTQTYYELLDRLKTDEGIGEYFIESTFPLTGEKFYTDPTYYWYKRNFLDLMAAVKGVQTYNCTEGGTLIEDPVKCINLEEFINEHK